MAKFRQRERKHADDGSDVILWQDIHDGSWFIGRPGDRGLSVVPMGGFSSAAAARDWADAQFRGGTWHRDRALLHRA